MSTLTLVVASDDPQVRAALERLFGPPHYDLLSVDPRTDLPANVRSASASLLILDLDGRPDVAAVGRLKGEAAVPTLVLASGRAQREAAIEAGAADVLMKPIDPDAATAKVETLLRLAENRSSLEERAKLDNVLDAMTDGVVLCDGEGRVRRQNGRAKTLFGETGGRRFFDLLDATFRVAGAPDLAARALRESVSFDAERPETEKTRPLVLEIRTGLVRNWLGEPDGFVALVADVTDKRKQSLQEEEFLNLISHKLRTPLAIVHKNASMFKMGVLGPLNENQTKFMATLHEKCCELVDSFEKLLGFTMLKTHKLELAPERVEPAVLLPERLDGFVKRLRHKPVQWSADYGPAGAAVNIHPKYLEMVLTNIVENASKFADKENAEIRLTVSAGPDVTFTVTDNGPGVPPEDREKVFDPFYQVDKERTLNVAGTGLGLAIARLVVKGHGGDIGLRSEMGRGSEFWFTLPRAEKTA